MVFSFVLLAIIAFGGMALTYLVFEEESFMWRLSAGSIAGSAIFGLLAFVAASFVGLSAGTVIVALLVTMLPLLLLRRPDIKRRFDHDWARAKGKLEGGSTKKALRFAYYAFFFLVFWYFFGKAVYQMPDGLYTGGSQNLGDLPFHLGAIFSFTEGNNFPAQNPSWAGAKFSYPFIADFLAACFVKLGIDFKSIIFMQNLTWAFALLVILERFTTRLTNNRLAGRIAPALLFLSGGLGFIWFFKEMGESGKGIAEFIMNIPRDYTIGDQFRWGNPMLVLFITQRGLLFGMPLAILVLNFLWKVFSREDVDAAAETEKGVGKAWSMWVYKGVPVAPFLIGLLAGTFPLIHLHSLAMLFIVTAFLFALQPSKWKEWVAFGVGVSLVAVPQLLWSISGSATETSKFFGWHFGWDKKPDDNVIWFWIKNTGIVIPAIIAGAYLVWTKGTEEDIEKPQGKQAKKEAKAHPVRMVNPKLLLLFYLPFAFIFLLGNTVKLAPWQWDNIKVLIYWFVGSLPLIAVLLAFLWRRNTVLRGVAILCLVVLVLSGTLDVWRAASNQVKIRVFDTDAMRVAEQLKQKTPQNALFLNAPTYNPAVVLAGRQSLMRFNGHLGSYGIDYGPREADVRRIYEGSGMADSLLEKYNIDYVLISPEEKTKLKANEEFFKKFPVIAESGQYRVHQIKK